MAPPTDKLLALLLVFVLGLLPFASPTSAHAQMPVPDHGTMQMSAGDLTTKSECDSCSGSHSCNGTGCACYQCGTCSATLLLEALTVPTASLTRHKASPGISRLSAHPFTIFRPPRNRSSLL